MTDYRNFENRTLYHGNNLGFLRGLNSGSVDLIATDPPFNKGRDFHATPDSLASGAKFQDRWSWERDVHDDWVDQIKDDWPGVWAIIDAARGQEVKAGRNKGKREGEDIAAFLCFLGVRLIEMRRVLKDTGSIYLHCDGTADYWIRALMDAVFGRANFRNAIKWCYTGPGNVTRWFPRKSDTILFYVKDDKKAVFNPVRVPRKELGGAGFFGAGMDADRAARLAELRTMGKPVEDYWTDIGAGAHIPKGERVGYPTQKPLALYERIIAASSNPGDVVLDPFCGCATTPIAAERLGRQWIGMDLWDKAHQTVLDRLESEGLAVPDGGAQPEGQQRMITFGEVHYRKEAPERTDRGEVAAPFLYVPEQRALEAWERMSRDAIMDELANAQRGQKHVVCAGCGRELEREFMHLDHRQPRTGKGANYITNRVLLCAPCNGRKGATLTMPGLVTANRQAKWTKDAAAAAAADDRAHACAERVRNRGRGGAGQSEFAIGGKA